LENQGYAVGAAIVGAHSIGAPHIRQRLYWLADSARGGRREERAHAGGLAARDSTQGKPAGPESGSSACGLAESQSEQPHGRGDSRRGWGELADGREFCRSCGAGIGKFARYGEGRCPGCSGWATPTARDHKDGASDGTAPIQALLGRQVWLTTGSPAETASTGQLNPELSRWLMGYPTVWGSCGATAMQSFHKSPRRS
jgi:hypothetical protein